jgi:hypothetical protein
MPDDAHQIANDLRVRLAVEPVVRRPRRSEDFGERVLNRAAPCPVRPDECAVDVEENELHDA